MKIQQARTAVDPHPPSVAQSSRPGSPTVSMYGGLPAPIASYDRRPRILIVDDERAILDLLSTLFEDEAWAPLCARSAEEAWPIVATGSIDAILCDVSMPRMSGTELFHALRAASLIDGIPFVLMSAQVRRVEGAGTAFVPKPFDLDEVVALLERLVRRPA